MTVRHVVSWKLAETDPETKNAQVGQISDGLRSLPPVVPAIRSLQVGRGGVGEDNWDIVLIADFDDAAGLTAYIEHPKHQKVAALIRSLVSNRAAVDFEV